MRTKQTYLWARCSPSLLVYSASEAENKRGPYRGRQVNEKNNFERVVFGPYSLTLLVYITEDMLEAVRF